VILAGSEFVVPKIANRTFEGTDSDGPSCKEKWLKHEMVDMFIVVRTISRLWLAIGATRRPFLVAFRGKFQDRASSVEPMRQILLTVRRGHFILTLVRPCKLSLGSFQKKHQLSQDPNE
jgi:hypothetical protein